MLQTVMNRFSNLVLCLFLIVLTSSVNGDVLVKLPDNQQAQPDSDYTGDYIDKSNQIDSTTENNLEQAVLSAVKKWDQGTTCYFTLRLRNTTSYHIRSVVPQVSAIIKDNVVLGTVSAEFFEVQPSKEQNKNIRFLQTSCTEILGLKISIARHCNMGALSKLTPTSEDCGNLIRVHKSPVVNIFKEE